MWERVRVFGLIPRSPEGSYVGGVRRRRILRGMRVQEDGMPSLLSLDAIRARFSRPGPECGRVEAKRRTAEGRRQRRRAMASIARERATRVDGAAPWGRESRSRLPGRVRFRLAALGDADRRSGLQAAAPRRRSSRDGPAPAGIREKPSADASYLWGGHLSRQVRYACWGLLGRSGYLSSSSPARTSGPR